MVRAHFSPEPWRDDREPAPFEPADYVLGRKAAPMTEEEMLHELISMERHRYEAAIEPWVKRLAEIAALVPPAPVLVPRGVSWFDEEPPHIMPMPMTFDGEAGR